METQNCRFCNTSGHLVRSCPELYAPLYGKLGEGAQKGGGHSHDEEEERAKRSASALPKDNKSAPPL